MLYATYYAGGIRRAQQSEPAMRQGARVRMVGTFTAGTVEHVNGSGRPELESAWVRWDCGRSFSCPVRNLKVVG
jgi:hypothetical protein